MTLLDAPVRTARGPVVGRTRAVAVNGADVTVGSWRGLPHSAPPARRFGPAGPPPSWSAPRDALVAAPPSPQVSRGEVVGDEWHGGRTLDVVAPVGADGLPVLVFVHGGAFVTGGPGDHDATYLAARLPAVVVTVSYRLGAPGFLTTSAADPTPALTDLLAALAWVAESVAAFGGDPARVTLAGHSAGAALVCSLMTTPGARGRFTGAVVLSGGAWTRDAAEHDGAVRAFRDALGADPATAPVADLVHAADRVPTDPGNPRGTAFLPWVDGTVLPAEPLGALRAGVLADGPLWVQTCRDEMALFRPDLDPDEQARRTAAWWGAGADDLAAARRAGGGSVWTTRFDHAPGLPPFDTLGPTHGADNACLWAHPPRFVERPLLGRPGAVMGPDDLAATAALHARLASFVHAGHPA